MSDSDDFFGDDSDFDDSDGFNSEDPEIRDGFVPSKSKNQEEDAVDSQRKAEAIAQEEAG